MRINKPTGAIIALLLITVIGVTAKTAHAQSGFKVPIRAKVGAYQPTGGGSTGLMAEIDVAMPLIGIGGGYFTAGYGEFTKSGKNLQLIPLTYSYVFALPNPATRITGNIYFGAGAGLYLLHAGGKSKSSLGGFGMVGYSFPNDKTFLELKYHLSDSVGGVSSRGFALMLGTRF